MKNINKVSVANTLKQSIQCYQHSKYICEGYQQQQQLSLHSVSWVLPNLQMTIQNYFTCKNKMNI